MTLVKRQEQASHIYIQQAEEHFRQGDLQGASKSAWDAVESCLKSAAKRRGWSHETHLDLSRVVSRLAKESDDAHHLHTLFGSVGGLYVNSYEDWFTDSIVKTGIEDAKELATMLKNYSETTE